MPSVKSLSKLGKTIGSYLSKSKKVASPTVTTVKNLTIAGGKLGASAMVHPITIAGASFAGASALAGYGLYKGAEGVRGAAEELGLIQPKSDVIIPNKTSWLPQNSISSPDNPTRQGYTTEGTTVENYGTSYSWSAILLFLGVIVAVYFIYRGVKK